MRMELCPRLYSKPSHSDQTTRQTRMKTQRKAWNGIPHPNTRKEAKGDKAPAYVPIAAAATKTNRGTLAFLRGQIRFKTSGASFVSRSLRHPLLASPARTHRYPASPASRSLRHPLLASPARTHRYP